MINARRVEFKKSKRLYVISTEGAETEPIYFQEFRPSRDGTFRLRILGNPTHKSHPMDVVRRLIDYDRREHPGANTEFWAIIDRNAWSERDLLKAYTLADGRPDFHIAMSNPCFELWLWLHIQPNRPFNDRADCERRLERAWLQFSKSTYPAEKLMPHIGTACDRAAAITTPDSGLLRSQGSQVFRLVRRLAD